MANSLALFPSRVRFVNNDGTLTPEAYRALLEVATRINSGSATGDTSEDAFSRVISEFVGHPTYLETVTQTPTNSHMPQESVCQQQELQTQVSDVVQPANGINAAITSANLTGKTITVTNGLITNFI